MVEGKTRKSSPIFPSFSKKFASTDFNRFFLNLLYTV